MSDAINEEVVRAMIETWKGDRPYRKAAGSIGLTGSWLHQILSGKKKPCGKVLDAIGVKRNPRGRGKSSCVYYLTGA